MLDFTFPGCCRSGLVSAHLDPGESHSLGLGWERSSGPSQDGVGKDCCLRSTRHPAHSQLQTGEADANLRTSVVPQMIQPVTAFFFLFMLLTTFFFFFFFVQCPQSVCEQDVRALVLVPTKELGQQVQTMIRQLTAFCSRDVRVADISGKADLSAQRSVWPNVA